MPGLSLRAAKGRPYGEVRCFYVTLVVIDGPVRTPAPTKRFPTVRVGADVSSARDNCPAALVLPE